MPPAPKEPPPPPPPDPLENVWEDAAVEAEVGEVIEGILGRVDAAITAQSLDDRVVPQVVRTLPHVPG